MWYLIHVGMLTYSAIEFVISCMQFTEGFSFIFDNVSLQCIYNYIIKHFIKSKEHYSTRLKVMPTRLGWYVINKFQITTVHNYSWYLCSTWAIYLYRVGEFIQIKFLPNSMTHLYACVIISIVKMIMYTYQCMHLLDLVCTLIQCYECPV